MGTIWFVVAVVFFILWLRGRDTEFDETSEPYRRGYAAGYAARDTAEQQAGVPEPAAEVAAPLVAAQPLVETPSDDVLAAQKARTALRNMNTLLYFASFLLVAAAAAFIATATPPLVRLIGLIVVVVLLYGGGLLLHQRVARLKPAATAFVGTGLAVLPFIGVALHTLGGMTATTAWLIVSGLGVVAYYSAAVVLRSQVVSYLTLAFVLSLVSAGVGVAALPLLWYFVGLISVSLIASAVSLAMPAKLPALFREPIERTGQVVTPVVLVASLFVAPQLSVFAYQIIFALATAQYVVAWLQQASYQYETVARVLAQISLLLVAWDVAGFNRALFGYLAALLFVLQAVYSLVRLSQRQQAHRSAETAWLVVSLTGLQISQLIWLGTEHAALLSGGMYGVSALLAVGAAVCSRRARWLHVATVMSVPFALIMARLVPEQPVTWPWLTVLFGGMAAAALAASWYTARRWRATPIAEVTTVASLVYLGMMTLSGLMAGDTMTIGQALAALTVGLVVLSYTLRRPTIEAIAALPLVGAVTALLGETSLLDSRWYGTVVIVVSAMVPLAAMVLYHTQRQLARRDRQYGVSLVIGGLLVTGVFSEMIVQQTHLVLLLVAALALIGGRIALRRSSLRLRRMTTIAYVSYVLLAWLLVLSLGALWMALAATVAMIVFWLASFVERKPLLMVVGTLALIAMVGSLWSGLALPLQWQSFGVGWVSAAVLYGSYWLLLERGDRRRASFQLWSVWLALAGVLLVNSGAWQAAEVVAWSLTVLLGAATVGIYGATAKRRGLIEVAVYIATIGAQRLVELALPELNYVLYAHWWALTIAGMAWWQHQTSPRTVWRLVVAMAALTLSSASAALDQGGWYQSLFLVEHVALLAIGALRSIRWALWWGVSASSLAVLYFLRDYTYLWLAFLGVLLISIVIWRLLKQNKDNQTD